MRSSSPPDRAQTGISPLARRVTVVATAAAIALVPAFALAPAAFAADPAFTVTSPTQAQTNVPNNGPLVDFTGTGLADGDTVQVLYQSKDGSLQPAIFGGTTTGDNPGDWEATANFDQLTPGSKQVIATVEEVTDNDAATVVSSTPLTFTLETQAVDPSPFAVTSPGVGDTVNTITPTFTGTGTPGQSVKIQYTGRSGHVDIAGTGTIGNDGTFSIVTDFSDFEPGAGASADSPAGIQAYITDADGNQIPGSDVPTVLFYFATPPVALIPLTLTVNPTSETVTASSSTGSALTATGFSPDEELTLTVTDPSGAPVTLGGTRPDQIFASEADGSYADTIVLPANATPGAYTVTLTGVRTTRTVSATLTVTADPVSPTTPPAVAGGSSSSSTGTGKLASTGLDGIGIGSLAGVLLLIGGGLVVARRRSAKA